MQISCTGKLIVNLSVIKFESQKAIGLSNSTTTKLRRSEDAPMNVLKKFVLYIKVTLEIL